MKVVRVADDVWSDIRADCLVSDVELASALREAAQQAEPYVPLEVRPYIAGRFSSREAGRPPARRGRPPLKKLRRPRKTSDSGRRVPYGPFDYWRIWQGVLFGDEHPPSPVIARAILADPQQWEPELCEYLADRLLGKLAARPGARPHPTPVHDAYQRYWVSRLRRWHRAIAYLKKRSAGKGMPIRLVRLLDDDTRQSPMRASLLIVQQESGINQETLRRWKQAVPKGEPKKPRVDLFHRKLHARPRTDSPDKFFLQRIRNARSEANEAYWKERWRAARDSS